MSADAWKEAVANALGMDYGALGLSSPETAESTIRTALNVSRLAGGTHFILLELRSYVVHPKHQTPRRFVKRVVLTALPPLGARISLGELDYDVRTLSWIDGRWVSAQQLVMDDTIDYHEEVANLVRIGWHEEATS